MNTLSSFFHQTTKMHSLLKWIVAFLVVGSVVCLHLYRLEDFPAGVTTDEAITVGHAVCLVESGKDANGVKWPLFPRSSVANALPPVLMYSSLPLVMVMQDAVVAVRLTTVFYVFFGMLFIGLLAYSLWRIFWLALLASALYGVVPWLFLASRYAAEYGVYPATMIAAIYFWVLAVRKNSAWLAGLSGVLWAIAFYSYVPSRLMMPLYLVGLLWCYSTHLKNRWKMAGACVLAFLCGLVPAFVHSLRNPDFFMSRLTQISVNRDGMPLPFAIKNFLQSYADYFSIGFFSGPGSPWLETPYGGMPMLLIACVLPLIAGGYFLFKNFKADPFWMFLSFAVASYPFAACMTYDTRVWTRTIQGAPLFILIVCTGVYFLWQSGKQWKVVVLGFGIFGIVESALFFHHYFGDYQALVRFQTRAGVYQALAWQPTDSVKPRVIYVSRTLMLGLWDFDTIDVFLPAIWRLNREEIRKRELNGEMPQYKLYNKTMEEITKPGDLIILKSPSEEFNFKVKRLVQVPNNEDSPPNCILLKEFKLPTLKHEQPAAIKIYRKQ